MKHSQLNSDLSKHVASPKMTREWSHEFHVILFEPQKVFQTAAVDCMTAAAAEMPLLSP